MADLQLLRDRYVNDSIHTASPARLLLMLLDRLCLDLEIAEAALGVADLATSSQRLVHAQDIVFELQSSLDHTVWDAAGQLTELYAFVLRLLIEANVAKDPVIVGTCRRLVEPLRDAWHAAARLQHTTQPLSTSA